MPIPRAIVLDLLNRYPAAADVEEATEMHAWALKAKVDEKWAELAAAERAVTEFHAAVGAVPRAPEPAAQAGPPTAQQVGIPRYRRDAIKKPIIRRLRSAPPANQSRMRVGTDTVEYRYVSGEYIALAASARMGTPDGDEAVWLSPPELATIREVVRNRKVQRDMQH